MDYTRLFRSMVLAAAASALLVPATRADVARRIVADGETVAIPHAYTYYRFVVKKRSATTEGFRLAEIALYDADGVQINEGLAEAAAEDKATTNLLAGTYALYRNQSGSVYESFDKMFDGDASTRCNAWINTADSEWHWWYFVMRPASGSSPAASYNVALSTYEPNKNPRSWALQASDDHEAWVPLHEYDADASPDAALSSGGWCNGGTPFAVAGESSHFFIERGGTLAITGDATPAGIHSYGGAVSMAAGATLGIDVASGESDRLIGGGLAGAGAFEKTGAGTLAVSGVNSGFAGNVKASGGTLAFRPLHVTPKFTYYRFVVRDRDTENKQLRIGEIALYDANGNRINANLSIAQDGDKATTNLNAGTFAVYGNGGPFYNQSNMFDGNVSTAMNGWAQPYTAEWAWYYIVFHLAQGVDVAPASYNVGFAAAYNPRSWALQGSDDHTTWYTLDERSTEDVTAIAPSGAGWCNGGTPLPLTWEGYNAPVGEVDAKFFRFTVKAVGNGTTGTRAISELALYDMQGKRLNVGLSSAGWNVSAASLAAGSFTWKYHWTGSYDGGTSHEEMMFDEDLSTRLSGWGWDTQNPSSPETWLVWTMRLADDAAPVASYNFAPFGTPGSSSCPVNWLVEASKDGTTWFEADSRSGEAATALLPAAAKTYCNGGHPIGFTTGCDRWLCPTGAVVEVANGATLELPASGANSIAGLAIDLTVASPLGTIANFNPAASGTLYLTSASRKPQLDDAAMPITFTGLANAANVENWNVVVNGVAAEADEYALGFDENDVLRVTRRRGPTVIYMR